jgi:YVTN family beta-propeller protein
LKRLRLSILAATAAAAAAAVALQPAPARGDSVAYVANRFSNDVTIIDAASGEPLDTLPIGDSPADVIFSRAARFAYVAVAGATSDAAVDQVAIVDVASAQVIDAVNAGDAPAALDLSADGHLLFVANGGRAGVSDGTLSILDARSSRGGEEAEPMLATVPLGGDPGGVAVSPDGRRVYVTNTAFTPDNVVFVVDVDTAFTDPDHAVVDRITVGNGPLGIAITPDGRRAYVANSAFGSTDVSIIDLEGEEPTRTVKVGSRPFDVAASPDGRFV